MHLGWRKKTNISIYWPHKSTPRNINSVSATQAIETMLKEIKGTEEHLYELAALYLQDNQLDNALKAYNQAEAALGISELSSLQKQRIYLIKGKLNEAIAESEKLIPCLSGGGAFRARPC